MYQLNEKIRDLKPYDPIQGSYRCGWTQRELPAPAPGHFRGGPGPPSSIDFNRYPDPAAGELCAAFAACYGVSPELVVAGNGSDELITVLFEAFLQKGDAFATLEPDFSMYAFNGHLHEARHIPLQKGPDYRIALDKLIETCHNENKALVFSNPCNPPPWCVPGRRWPAGPWPAGYPGGLGRGLHGLLDQSLLPRWRSLTTSSSCAPAPRPSVWPPCAWASPCAKSLWPMPSGR